MSRAPARPRRRVLTPIAAMSVVAGLAGGLASVGSAAPAGALAAPRFVALGDSYAAGPLTATRTGGPLGCMRSRDDYASDTASALGLDLTDVTCVGATTGDLTSPQPTPSGTNPPQLAAVTPGTAVVSLTVGGNDLGFKGILEDCVAATPWGPTREGRTCEQHYSAGGHDVLTAKAEAVGHRVGALLEQIHARARSAAVFVVGYPDVLPPTGAGCWPRVPFTEVDVPYLRGVEQALNAALAAAARSNGATYVDTYTPTEAHNACTTGATRWVQSLVPTRPALPFHPDRAGEAAMATALTDAVQSRSLPAQ